MTDKVKMTCGKCNGKGYLSEYKHISGGQCFACNGKGFYYTTQRQLELKEKRKQEKNKQAEKVRQYNHNKFNIFLEEFKNDIDFLERMNGLDPEGRGELLAWDIMNLYESKGKFQYEVI